MPVECILLPPCAYRAVLAPSFCAIFLREQCGPLAVPAIDPDIDVDTMAHPARRGDVHVDRSRTEKV